MQLTNLNLTEADFDTIIDGLDALPSRHFAGEMMSDLMGDMLLGKDESPQAQRIKAEREQRRRDQELKRRSEIERVKILQGKLLQIRQQLRAAGALTFE